MTRCILYARVSTDEQAEKYGIPSQLHELRALAAARGYTVVPEGELIDEGYSGATLDRPALDRLRTIARAKAVDVVLIHDPDRLVLQLVLLEELERSVRVEFVTTPTEATPEGRLLLNVKGVIGEYEREKIRERTTRGRKEKARRGLLPGGPWPYGYRPDPARPGQVVVDEAEAAVVRMIFRWLIDEGRSLRAIVMELRALGVRPARSHRWAASSVRRLLANAFYAGQAYYNRREVIPNVSTGRRRTGRRFRAEADWIPINVPAIITPTRFAQARDQLQRNRHVLTGRPGRVYLLRGLLVCPCGRHYAGSASHGHRFYRCSGRDRLAGPERCRAGLLHAGLVESRVWTTLSEILSDPDVLLSRLAARAERLGIREVELRSEVEHLERQLAALDGQEHRLLDLYLHEELRTDAVRERLLDLGHQRQALRDRLTRARTQAARQRGLEAHQDAIRESCARALRGLARLDAEGRQRLLRTLLDRVLVRPDGLEIHGILPARWESSRTSGHSAQFNPLTYQVVVPLRGGA